MKSAGKEKERDGNGREREDTHLTHDLPKQKPRELREDEEHGGERAVVCRGRLFQHAEDDPRHQQEVGYGWAVGGREVG